MQDVADALGVAKATVSRAFRNHPKCGAELRARILAKAQEMGYTPDPLQRVHMAQVRAGRPEAAAGTVIWMLDYLPYENRVEVCASNSRFMRGARARAESLGLKLEMFRPQDHGFDDAALKRVMRARGISGAIVAPMRRAHSTLDLDFEGVAAVAIAHSLERPVLHRVSHDHYKAIWAAMDRLRELGLKRVGLAVGAPLAERLGWRWHAAYAEYCRAHTDMVKAPPLESVWFLNHDAMRDGALAWAKRHRFDVVMSVDSWINDALKSDRKTRGVRYCELDWYPGKTNGAYLRIDQNFEQLGAAAVEEVVAQWGRQEYGVPKEPKTILLSGKLLGSEERSASGWSASSRAG